MPEDINNVSPNFLPPPILLKSSGKITIFKVKIRPPLLPLQSSTFAFFLFQEATHWCHNVVIFALCLES